MSEDPTLLASIPDEDDTLPKVSGFTLTQVLSNKGGMADVYLAMQHGNERQVIIKFLRDNDANYKRRFREEAIRHSEINHPNVVTIYTVGESQGQPYIAMEYLAGGDLSEAIAKGLGEQSIKESLIAIANALAATHKRGIIHRDLKPENILFTHEGVAKLADFGIARSLEHDGPSLTQANMCIGTPSYMSPEQIKGQTLDASSDIYSLGLVLYEMLTGKKAYSSPSIEATLYSKVHEDCPALPPHLGHWQALLNNMSARDKAQRFTCAEDLITALESLDLAAKFTPANEFKKEKKAKKGNAWRFWLAATALLLLLPIYFVWQDYVEQSAKNKQPIGVAIQSSGLQSSASQAPAIARFLNAKLVVPYDQADCTLASPSTIDFIPYLSEPLKTGNCFAIRATWQDQDELRIVTDVVGAKQWVQLYPNECGNVGVESKASASKGIHLPTINGLERAFTLDDSARTINVYALSYTSKNAQAANSTNALTQRLAALPSICALRKGPLKGEFDIAGLESALDLAVKDGLAVVKKLKIVHQSSQKP